MEGGLREALQVWQGIKLSELQKELDHQGQEIVNNQREAQASRKTLAEQTRDFKKTSSEEGGGGAAAGSGGGAMTGGAGGGTGFKTLLKNYQTEIDSLTKRSKFAETCFLSLYKLLADAPDPAKMLENWMVHYFILPSESTSASHHIILTFFSLLFVGSARQAAASGRPPH